MSQKEKPSKVIFAAFSDFLKKTLIRLETRIVTILFS